MSSSTSKRNSRRARLAAIAAVAGIGIAGIASASPAFASGTPGPAGQLNGTVIIPSTLSIAPAISSFSITAQPGAVTDTPAFLITTGSSDGSGYSLVEDVQAPFAGIANSQWATDSWAETSRGGNGSGNYALSDPTFGPTGTAVTLFTTDNSPAGDLLSGMTGLTSTGLAPNSHPYSDGNPGTHDIFTSQLHLTLPANQPGSAGDGGVNGAFDYQVIGS